MPTSPSSSATSSSAVSSPAVSSPLDSGHAQILSTHVRTARVLSVIALCISIFSLIYIVCKWNDYKDEINKPFLYMVSDQGGDSDSDEVARSMKQMDRTYTLIRYKLRQIETTPTSTEATFKKQMYQRRPFKSASSDTFIPILDFGKYKVEGYCTLPIAWIRRLSPGCVLIACIGMVDTSGEFKETLLEGPPYQIASPSTYSTQPFAVHGIIQLYGKGQYNIGCFLKIKSTEEHSVFVAPGTEMHQPRHDSQSASASFLGNTHDMSCSFVISRLD